jgi:hypothetical protein
VKKKRTKKKKKKTEFCFLCSCVSLSESNVLFLSFIVNSALKSCELLYIDLETQYLEQLYLDKMRKYIAVDRQISRSQNVM